MTIGSPVSRMRSQRCVRTWPISVEIVMDAVAMRLLDIGEAVKGLSPELTATEPEVDWTEAAGMRDFLAHHYLATRPDITQLTLDKRLPILDRSLASLPAADRREEVARRLSALHLRRRSCITELTAVRA